MGSPTANSNVNLVDRTRVKGLKLYLQGRFRLEVRKHFSESVVMHWSRLPKELVESPSLEMLTKRVEITLSEMA